MTDDDKTGDDKTEHDNKVADEAMMRDERQMSGRGMGKGDFKYDVAFSFLAGEEELAIRIAELLEARLSVFIYSKKQEELAGKDGEEKFNSVFGTESRVVFVLYREGWGETSWTRIEQTAIRNRAYDEGYDFVVVAPLDTPSKVPKWLPKTRLWLGLDRWGVEGAASVVEARVQEAGGLAHEETVEERAARLGREIDAEQERKDFLNSENGVEAAKEEVARLFGELERSVKHVSTGKTTVKLSLRMDERKCAIYGDGFSVSLDWRNCYSNTLDSSGLSATLWDGNVSFRGELRVPPEQPKRMRRLELEFDVDRAGNPRWRVGEGEQSATTEDVAKEALTMLLEEIRKRRAKRS